MHYSLQRMRIPAAQPAIEKWIESAFNPPFYHVEQYGSPYRRIKVRFGFPFAQDMENGA
jgi:hypothetical protein